MIQHRGPISGVAAFRDQFVATAGYDNQVILWDQRTGRSLGRAVHDHLANHCSFNPDGSRLLTSSSDYTARLWSVPDLRLLAVFNRQHDDVEMSVFHSQHELVATASRDHRVRVYGFSGQLLHTFSGHTADVISVEWAHTGDELISSSDDGTIKRWSLSADGLVESIDLNGVETDTVAVDPGGTIFAGNDDGQLVVVRPTGRELIPAHQAGIKRLVLDRDRGLLVSLSYDRMLRIWDVSGDRPAPIDEAALPADVWPRSCAFAAGSNLVFGTFGATYQTYDYQQRRWSSFAVPPTFGVNAACTHEGTVLSIGDAGITWRDGVEAARTGSLCNFLTPVTSAVITGGQLGCVFDALTGAPLHQHRSPLNCAARFERGGVEHVIVGAYTGEGVVLRASEEGVRHGQDVQLHDNAVKGVAVSEDYIFSVCADGSAAWHSTTSLKPIKVLKDAHDRIANGCVGLGEGCFASVSRDLKLRIWNRDFTATVVNTPHTHSVKCVAATTDGRKIATGSYHGHVAIYDRATSSWSTFVRPTAAGISSLAYDAERDCFLASSYDGNVYTVSDHGTMLR